MCEWNLCYRIDNIKEYFSPFSCPMKGFLLGLGLMISACQSAPLQGEAPVMSQVTDQYQGLSIFQGVTTAHSTQIGILIPQGLRPRFQLQEEKSQRLIEASSQRLIPRPFSSMAVQQLTYSGLRNQERYRFTVLNSEGLVLDERWLKPLPAQLKQVRIAVVSCLDDSYRIEQKEMWRELYSQEPDLLFMIGDNVYADKNINFYKGPASPRTIWERFVESTSLLEIYRMKNLIPIFASWDDHDFGQDNGGEDFRYKDASADIFRAFFPRQKAEGTWTTGPGMSGHFQAFGYQFYFLDNRSFRSTQSDSLKKTHLGLNQLNWINRVYSAYEQLPAIFLGGDQFFGAYHNFESYQGQHPEEFQSLLALLKNKKTPVLFISGDLHRAEFMTIPQDVLGYETHEITTSPMHAKTFPEERFAHMTNPLDSEQFNLKLNYLILDLKTGVPTEITGKATIYGRNQDVIFRKSIAIQRN